jgi:hypothetical protein
MRDLDSALEDHDLITLRVIGDWWELDLIGADKQACLQALSKRLRQIDLTLELNYLPPEEAAALQAVIRAGGRIAVGAFARQFGDVRQMGPGRLEREEPWLAPENAAEALWYRGLLFRGFDNADDSGNLVEYYYVPVEFKEQFADEVTVSDEAQLPDSDGLSRLEPPATITPAMPSAVDDLTTLLSFGQRNELKRDALEGLAPFLLDATAARSLLLVTLAEDMGLLQRAEGSLRPTRMAADWLKESRSKQAAALATAWRGSSWNELRYTPGIRCEGSGWQNNPVSAREALLTMLPQDVHWHQVDELVSLIKATIPDFQRPEGNYETWYIRDVARDVYLKGFESWDDVEGRLLRFLIEGPLVWLGLSDTGEGKYRLTERAAAWLAGKTPADEDINVPIVVQPEAVILVPFNASRYERFQVARVAEPMPLESGERTDPYRFQLTPESLRRANEEGIRPDRVLSFLEKTSGRTIPTSVRRAIERWSDKGLEGRLQTTVILRVRDAAILDTLQSNPKTRPYIGERLGDLAAVLQIDDWRAFQQLTAQLGLLLDHVD